MGQIQVDSQTSCSHIQQPLENFGMFSKVEATLDQSTASTVYLREVGLMEQLRRLFSPGAAQRLFAFSRTGVHQTTLATPRDFFLTHLNSLSGRVVIALTGDPEIDSAACEAARGMTQPPPPESREVIFASPNSQVLAAAQAWMQ